ncbi:MAG TPA: hypothetical protein VFP80_08200, partial [Thermoanaerobaculia bacterium]|nr:hypothetical protein [Thermoanaerobaculia bacterium]
MIRTKLTLLLGAAILIAGPALAQSTGRLTFFGTFQHSSFDNGTSRDFSEFSTAVVYRSQIGEDAGGLEYALDLRSTAYPSSEERDPRTRIYDAWAGGRIANGHLTLRAGQMWLHELGALGSVGGVMAEYRGHETAVGRLRAGLFGGAEPKSFDTGFVTDVKKGGAWIALDGRGMRRHVLGYVTTRNSSLTERSVLSTTNFLPLGPRVFLYQLAEYDLKGPGGTGGGGLNYFFANARYTASRRVEILATVHRGRSIDARSISDDLLNGRPVDQKTLDGFLFESAGGRVTVEVLRNVRVYAGYARDRYNREEQSFGRISAGVWAANVAGSGIDITLSDNRSDRSDGSYDAWYASLGRGFGSRVYLSVDYSTSLAIVHVLDGGTIVERRPRSRRYGMSGIWNITRMFALTMTLEQLRDDTADEDRGTVGLIV